MKGELLAALLFLLQAGAVRGQDDALHERVRALVEPRLPVASRLTGLDLGQPAARIRACSDPRPYLVHPRQVPVGRVALGVSCGSDETVLGYIQARVGASGTYMVSARRIAAGETITADMLVTRRGPLENLPKGSALRAEQLLGRQAARGVEAGAVLALKAVRERWLVERNARVSLKAQGNGFSLSRDGKALDNGSLGTTVRFLSSDGRMFDAQVVGKNQLQLRY